MLSSLGAPNKEQHFYIPYVNISQGALHVFTERETLFAL